MATSASIVITNSASAGTYNLPQQFSYEPISPYRRSNITRTAGGNVIQEAKIIYPADFLLSWSIEASTQDDYAFLRSIYAVDPASIIQFLGYWGEDFTIKPNVIDNAVVRANIFNYGGSFYVTAVASYGSSLSVCGEGSAVLAGT